MKIAHFDCFSGASGDMMLGALVSAGWPESELRTALGALPVDNYRMLVSRVTKQGLAATKVSFELPQEPPRSIGSLLDIVGNAVLAPTVRRTATQVLRRLGEVEAQVHGITSAVEDVHLHELGSLDTVFDVVGVVAGLEALGIEAVSASAINLGGGFMESAHGRLPVPGPAVASLVKGLPVYGGEASEGELCTPTGAVLLSVLAKRFGPLPQMRVTGVGCGAGLKDGWLPNILRLWVGEDGGATDDGDVVVLLECNIDDMNPEWYGPLIDRLLDIGALDVYLTPIIMKKGRPGIVLGVLCSPELSATLGEMILEETTTLGVRSSVLSRRKLDRTDVVVTTAYGPIRIKVGVKGDRMIKAAPEFEDCRRVAAMHNVSLKKVYEAAQESYRATNKQGDG